MTLYQRLVYTKARAAGFPVALSNLIVAQAMHESANFTSNVFKACNNAFGYKFVGQSRATACSISPEGDAYAKYTSLADSAEEIIDWIKRRQKEGIFPANLAVITTAAEYARLLKKAGYYGAPEALYANALDRHLKSLNVYEVPATGGFKTALLAAGLLFLTFRLWKKR
jgi:uncharacterized FlgJ-related protein